jgi:DNA-binding LacI/PurR family transcriptional regulator
MEQGKRVTIYDVAEKAGVTTATVSRVINKHRNVSPQTRARVIDAVKELGFFPSSVAGALSGKKIREVGIVSPFFLGDFFLKILESLHSNLKDHDVILYSAQSLGARKELFERIISDNKLSGLVILSSPIFPDDERILKKHRMPVVLLETGYPEFSSVIYDNEIGAFKAVKYLVELGHRDIAIITGVPEKKILSPIGKERLAGYKMALSLANVRVREEFIQYSLWTRQDANKYAKVLLTQKKRPTAIFASSDYQALGVLDAAGELGIRIPEELSVVGYDNTELSDVLSVTTVMQQYDVMSHVAVRILFEEIRTGINKKEQVVLQPEMVVRKTTAPPAG